MNLDEAIQFVSPAEEAPDDYGNITITTPTPVDAKARVRPKTGTERYKDGVLQAPALYRFWIRNRDS
jgi:head-tail adaptor